MRYEVIAWIHIYIKGRRPPADRLREYIHLNNRLWARVSAKRDFKEKDPETQWSALDNRACKVVRPGEVAGLLSIGMNDIRVRKCSLSAWLNAILPETKNFKICSSRSSLVTFTGPSFGNEFPPLKNLLIEGELDVFELLRLILILRQILSTCFLIVEDTFEFDRPGCTKLVAQCLHRSLGSLDASSTTSWNSC